MSLYTKLKFNKLSVMYDGDKDRDATSKIRGFLFQDYITIMCLLQKQVKYVCSEYLEDVDVFFEDAIAGMIGFVCLVTELILFRRMRESR